MRKILGKSTGKSSLHFGNCDVCGKSATEVYSQHPEDGIFDFITKYGHKECITSKQ